MSNTPNIYDVIVLGVGGMGSAACYHLARRGAKVLGIEQYQVGHDRGSSHGETRLIRQAYFEHRDYVPLLKRAYELWDLLSEESGQKLFHRRGLAIYGHAEQSKVLAGIKDSAHHHKIPIEVMSAAEARKAFPAYHLPDDYAAIYEPGAGYLEVENCVRAHAGLAQHAGCDILEELKVLSWSAEARGVRVETSRGAYQAGALVVTAGAWSGKMLADLGFELNVHRNLLFWFPTADRIYRDPSTPCFGYDTPEGFFYGFPQIDDLGVKVAHHARGQRLEHPEDLKSYFDFSKDLEPVVQFIHRFMPNLELKLRHHAACMYEMSADEHFIIDRHPSHANVVFGAGFSGHGFKFSSVVGEVLADLALNGKTAQPVGFWGLGRFK